MLSVPSDIRCNIFSYLNNNENKVICKLFYKEFQKSQSFYIEKYCILSNEKLEQKLSKDTRINPKSIKKLSIFVTDCEQSVPISTVFKNVEFVELLAKDYESKLNSKDLQITSDYFAKYFGVFESLKCIKFDLWNWSYHDKGFNKLLLVELGKYLTQYYSNNKLLSTLVISTVCTAVESYFNWETYVKIFKLLESLPYVNTLKICGTQFEDYGDNILTKIRKEENIAFLQNFCKQIKYLHLNETFQFCSYNSVILSYTQNLSALYMGMRLHDMDNPNCFTSFDDLTELTVDFKIILGVRDEELFHQLTYIKTGIIYLFKSLLLKNVNFNENCFEYFKSLDFQSFENGNKLERFRYKYDLELQKYNFLYHKLALRAIIAQSKIFELCIDPLEAVKSTENRVDLIHYLYYIFDNEFFMLDKLVFSSQITNKNESIINYKYLNMPKYFHINLTIKLDESFIDYKIKISEMIESFLYELKISCSDKESILSKCKTIVISITRPVFIAMDSFEYDPNDTFYYKHDSFYNDRIVLQVLNDENTKLLTKKEIEFVISKWKFFPPEIRE